MAKHVVSTAVTHCIFGSRPSMLLVEGGHKDSIEGHYSANVGDHIPFVNIVPFGLCCSPFNPMVIAALGVPQPCIPLTPLPWMPGNDTIKLEGKKILDDLSICPCIWAGIIFFLTAGQGSSHVAESVPEGKKEELKQQALDKIEELKQTEEGRKLIDRVTAEATKNSKLGLLGSAVASAVNSLKKDDSKKEETEKLVTLSVNPKWRRTGLGKPTEDISTLIRMPGAFAEKVVNKIIDKYTPLSSNDTRSLPDKFTNWTAEVNDPKLAQEVKKSLQLDNATDLNEGYIYIFAQCKSYTENQDFKEIRLYKEYHANFVGGGLVYHEIDMSKEAGKDIRNRCRRTGYNIELPYKYEKLNSDGKIIKSSKFDAVYAMYSPTQLSWERIGRLGGISPDDTRLEKMWDYYKSQIITKQQAGSLASLREKRCGGKIPQDRLDYLYSVQHEDKPVEEVVFEGSDTVEAWQKKIIFHNKKKDPILLLSDPAGEVLQGNIVMDYLFDNLRNVMNKIISFDNHIAGGRNKLKLEKIAIEPLKSEILNQKFALAAKYDLTTIRAKNLFKREKIPLPKKIDIISDIFHELDKEQSTITCLQVKDKIELENSFTKLLSELKRNKKDKIAAGKKFSEYLSKIPSEQQLKQNSSTEDDSHETDYERLSALMAYQLFIKKDYPGILKVDGKKMYYYDLNKETPLPAGEVPWYEGEASLNQAKIDYLLKAAERMCLHKLITDLQRTNTDIMLSKALGSGSYSIDINEEIKDYFARPGIESLKGYIVISSLMTYSCLNSGNIDSKIRMCESQINSSNTSRDSDGKLLSTISTLHAKLYSSTILRSTATEIYNILGTTDFSTEIIKDETAPAGLDYFNKLKDESFPLHSSIFHIAGKKEPGIGNFDQAAFSEGFKQDVYSLAANSKHVATIFQKSYAFITKKTHEAIIQNSSKLEEYNNKIGAWRERLNAQADAALGSEFRKNKMKVITEIEDAEKAKQNLKNDQVAMEDKVKATSPLVAKFSGLVAILALVDVYDKIIKLTSEGKFKESDNLLNSSVDLSKTVLNLGVSLEAVHGAYNTIKKQQKFMDTVALNEEKRIGIVRGKTTYEWPPKSEFEESFKAFRGKLGDIITKWDSVASWSAIVFDLFDIVNSYVCAGHVDIAKLSGSLCTAAGDTLILASGFAQAKEAALETAKVGIAGADGDASMLLSEESGLAADTADTLIKTGSGLAVEEIGIMDFMLSSEGLLVAAMAFHLTALIIKSMVHTKYQIWAENSTLSTKGCTYEPWLKAPKEQYADLLKLVFIPELKVDPDDSCNDEDAISVIGEFTLLADFLKRKIDNVQFENLWLYKERITEGIQSIDGPKKIYCTFDEEHLFNAESCKLIPEKKDEDVKQWKTYYSKAKLRDLYDSIQIPQNSKDEIHTSSLDFADKINGLTVIPAAHIKCDDVTIPSLHGFPYSKGIVDQTSDLFNEMLADKALKAKLKLGQTNWLGKEKEIF